MEKCRSITYFTDINSDSVDNTSEHEMLIADMLNSIFIEFFKNRFIT